MENRKIVKIIALAVTATMAISVNCFASTLGAVAGLSAPANSVKTIPATAEPSDDYGIGIPTNEALLMHLTVSGFEITVPTNWNISSKTQDGGIFKILTVSSPKEDRSIRFVMLSIKQWVALTEEGAYIIAVDQPTKLIYGYGISVTSSSTKTEREILQSAHFNNLQNN